ncbi:MAG: hypothetical protein ACHQIM_02575 [Sphingobacteriales bacterium]
MKHFFVLGAIMCLEISSLAGQTYPVPSNTECATAINICHDTTVYFDDNSSTIISNSPQTGPVYACNHSPFTLWFAFTIASSQNVNFTVNSGDGISSLTVFGPFTNGITSACPQIASNLATKVASLNTTFSTHSFFLPGLAPGEYLIALQPVKCKSSVSFSGVSSGLACNLGVTVGCDNCIPALSLTPGKQYVISSWVKEENAPTTKTSYTTPQLIVTFPSAPSTPLTFGPAGKIIDGWQRIEGQFTVPIAATDFNIKLNVLSGNAFFDDIRIFPFDGVMTSYVFDPVSLRLVALLDERNYATIYEYDKEGKLVRVKKETERGIMTIQENRTSIKKVLR